MICRVKAEGDQYDRDQGDQVQAHPHERDHQRDKVPRLLWFKVLKYIMPRKRQIQKIIFACSFFFVYVC